MSYFILVLFDCFKCHIDSVEQALEAASTSVAPPKCAGRSSTSFLPPAPTVSSSCSRINREPAVTATAEETNGEESTGEDGDDGDDGNTHFIIVFHVFIIFSRCW